jgi:hypothetical protein
MEAQNVYGIKQIQNLSQSARDYMNTNDMMSNVIFVLLILVISIIIFNTCLKLFIYFFTPSNSPHLIDGMVDSKDAEIKITQDPKDSTSKTILISKNQEKGLEFTWSFWIYIEDLDYRRGELKNVFVKGDNIDTNYVNLDAPCPSDLTCATPPTLNQQSILNLYRTLLKREPDTTGFNDYVTALNDNTKTLDTISQEIMNSSEYINSQTTNGEPNDEINNTINGPGVYLTPFDNKLLFVFNTYDNVIEKFEVDNIPMNNWLNVIMRCENKTIDVFMNSSFTKRYKLSSLPKQNYNNVYIGKNKGFSGYVSNLWYFNYALGTRAINGIFRDGANTNILNRRTNSMRSQVAKSGIFGSYKSNFLSFRWFFQ